MAKMGGARVFFTLLARMQVDKLVEDSQAAANIMKTVYVDAIDGVLESMTELFDIFNDFSNEVVDIARPVEEARIHFSKFFNDTEERALDLEHQLRRTGLAFGIGAEQSIEAGARMLQLAPVMGSNEAGVAATQASMLMGAVGMMDTDVAMSNMMKLQMQTGFMYEGFDKERLNDQQQYNVVLGNSIKFVDMLNEAENKTGATIQGVSTSLSQYSATAALANMEMSEQIALSASLIEQGEEQSKSGRALKMILARLASDRSNNNALLEKHGVLVKDEQGEMKGLIEIMTELKTQTDSTGRSWDQLTGIEKQNIAIAVAGSHHYVRFLKLMEGYDRTLQIQADVADSAGSAMEEFANFTESAAFQLRQLETAIENEAAVMGNHLIPAMREAAHVELLFAQARNAMLGKEGGQRLSMFMATSGVVLDQVGGIMRLVFGYRVLRMAMETMHIVQKQGLGFTQNTEKAQRMEAERLKMNTAMRRHYSQEYAKGISIENLAARGQYSRLQIEHAVNEGLMHRINLYKQTLRTSQSAYLAETKNSKIISQQRMVELVGQQMLNEEQIKGRLIDMQAAQARLANNEIQQQEIQARLQLGKSLSHQELHELNMTQARLRAEAAQFRLTIERVEFEAKMNNMLQNQNIQMLDAKQRHVLLDMMRAESQEHLARVNEIVNQSKASSIRLDQSGTANIAVQNKALKHNTQSKIHNAKADQLRARASTFASQAGMISTNSLMLASMATSFFGEEQDAAAASAALMTAAMVPMTLSMITYGAASTKAAVATTVATLGFAAVAGLAAFYLVKNSKHISAFDDEMNGLMDDIEDSQSRLDDLEKQFGMAGAEGAEFWADLDANATDSLDNTMGKMQEFSNMRQELFFGGQAGRMDQALFNEVKQNGVEKLFYAPEIHMVNNFNGLTYHEAAREIADLVEDRLELKARESVTNPL
jgi:TP901 family phage tail tape measure protein